MLLQYEKLQGFEIKLNNQIDPHRVVRIVKSKESLHQLAKVVHCKIIDAVMRLSLFTEFWLVIISLFLGLVPAMHFSRELHELACYLSIYPVIHLSNLSIHPSVHTISLHPSNPSMRVWMGLTDNWQIAKILIDNWQSADNLTDNVCGGLILTAGKKTGSP